MIYNKGDIEETSYISENILKYYNEVTSDENARFKSWEHCHKYFIEHKDDNNEQAIDSMSLQLAFYLASWGMYRGSSFLLKKDYRIHYEAVKEILNEKYSRLWDVTCEDLKEEKLLKLIMVVNKNLKDIYIDKRNDGKGDVSEILTTKILLGTFGCVPAYDGYFTDGIKYKKVSTGNFNEKSMRKLIHFYNENMEEFKFVKCKMGKKLIQYPDMKLIDMCFWQQGYEKNNK